MDEIVRAIKAKKELSNLDDEFVREKVENVFDDDGAIREKYRQSRDFDQFSRSREYKKLLKTVRRELRAVYGVFQHPDRDGLLEKGDVDGLLESHTSTKERLPHYDRIYRELADRMPAPRKILDLGCGLNPLSYAYMAEHGWRPFIIATDLSTKDMGFLQGCFRKLGYPGTAFAMDLTKDYPKLAEIQADVTFMLKLLDSLEEAERDISRKILGKLNSDWLVVSFPTKSLGGKKRISIKGRSWFERLLHEFGWRWETFRVENEFFYVIDTSV